jgi:spermidine synthase
MSDSTPTHSETPPALDRFLPPILLLFFGSGCAALIYEIVWYQMLQLVIGLTTLSLGLLLGSFMGGMCLGSVALSRLVSRGRHPLKVYAMLELGIGAIGLFELWLMPHVGDLYTQYVGHGLAGIMLRGVVAAVCLVPPTLLMGATLPAVARWVEATPQGVSWLGFFYGGNIAGAVFGCLLAGFYLLRVHDMATTTYVAAAINLAVAALALALASDGPAVFPAPLEPRPRVKAAPGAWAIYVTIALSGLCALGAEVVWTRLLSLLFGATVYTFSIILAVFLFGLGIGSALGSFFARSKVSPRIALGVCQLLLTLGIAWTAYMIADSLPFWPIDPSLADPDSPASPWFTFQMDIARTIWTILPAALLWGASFPLALAAVAERGQDPGRLVGGVYAANTLGAIAGALGFSLLAVPLVGTQWSQRLLIGLAGLSALVALVPLLFRPRRAGSGGPAFGVACVLVADLAFTPLLAWRVDPPQWGAIAYGRFVATYTKYLQPDITPEKDVPRNNGTSDIYCTYAGEGLNGTVAVTMTTSGVRSFHSAGKVQASNDPQDMRLQRLLGHISALAVNQPKTVLVVACGAGVTAGTFLLQPSVQRIVICDIEPLVPKYVTPQFTKENYGIADGVAEQNPRIINGKTVLVVYDDGRHYIRTSKEKFDVITSDPIDPWVKGCAALNTVEYYQMCKDHLNPGGVMSLWIPFYESNIPTAKSVLATFFKVFPNGILWSNDDNGSGYDAVLFGQAEPSHFDVDELQARLDRPEFAQVKQSLSDAGFPSAVDLLGTYAGRASELQNWMQDAEINTDANLRLQYLAGMACNSYIGTEILNDITKSYNFPTDLFAGSTESTMALRQAIEIPRNIHRAGLTAPPAPATTPVASTP